jgi:hypothetical protein
LVSPTSILTEEFVNGSPIFSENHFYTIIRTQLDFKKMDELHSDELHKGRVYNVLFTPDGKKLISSGEDWHIVIRSVCGED